jgi:L-rhamnose mutarotase
MRIFLTGRRLFMCVSASDSFDPKRDFPRVADDPVAAQWEKSMAELQEPVPEAGPEEWWALMEEVFDLNWPQYRVT